VFKGFLDDESQGESGSLANDALPIKVSSTISRASYGSLFKCLFVEGVHEEADKSWADVECQYMATNQVEWYLRRVSFRIIHLRI
jgi:hypothetical protein